MSFRFSPHRRTGLAAVAVAVLAGVATAAPAVADSPAPLRLTLPHPSGDQAIGTHSMHLVDESRTDPWTSEGPRELMVSVTYPARKTGGLTRAPHMLPGAAADFDKHSAPDSLGINPGIIDWAGTRAHSWQGAPVKGSGKRPVLVFSSGFALPRAFGTVLVEELASRGYVVVSVDHTYEAGQVEFPDGRVERTKAKQDDMEDIVKSFDTRVADMKFVLDTITDLGEGKNPDRGGRAIPEGLSGALDTSRIGMLGFSLGGAAAGQVALDDKRVDAGVDLDGMFFGTVAKKGLAKPFLIMGADTESDATWKEFRKNHRGWNRELRLTGATHGSFSDFQALFPQIARKLGLNVPDAVGTVDPKRSIAAQGTYVGAFFDLHLKNKPTRLFDGPSRKYPEVRHIR
ncbi:alpha/beta hydrolase family protein [Sinosporangium siamense]|uniref:Lipase n=1 Tax=Sinosporangium siamense TaxID=1367973 RepID=A0A919V930_9ACTN|nr:lipase [Sinosporangium siamense]GII94876.1 lipase [Sinosporangium siamense]